MCRIIFTVLLLSASLLFASQNSELVEGYWQCHGGRNILGEGSDTAISIQKLNRDWTISFQFTHHPSVNAPDKNPKITSYGPFPVTAKDGVLSIQKGKKLLKYTYILTDGILTMPAIVQQKPGLWIYNVPENDLTGMQNQPWMTSFKIKCENDPFKVPQGSAECPWINGGRGVYSYEEAPRLQFLPDIKYIRFLERTDKGYLIERFRLVFDKSGNPRYERILSSGQREFNEYRIKRYMPKTPTKKETTNNKAEEKSKVKIFNSVILQDKVSAQMWNHISLEDKKQLEHFLLIKLGLSSTGNIELVGIYPYTKRKDFANAGDKVLHFIQKDLGGSRLFWSCLINLKNKKYLILYHCNNPKNLPNLGTWNQNTCKQVEPATPDEKDGK